MPVPPALAKINLAEAVVFCGAGISTEAPSSLPTGDELALRVFDLTTGGQSYPYAADPIARLRREIAVGRLRLEVICDLLSNEIDAITVMSSFGLLRSSPPNRLHLALALLSPAALLTTNQDLLLEHAGEILGRPTRAVHLHGRCDRPRSIVTTVAGYLHGLSVRADRRLTRLIDGRDLVVLGYSGRDLDVMSSLLRTCPRRVLWIEHGKRRRVSELPPELLAAERHFGPRWTRIGLITGDWLTHLLNPTQRVELERALERALAAVPHPRRIASQQQRLERRFANLDDLSRWLAVGHVLRHAGLQRDAQLGYSRLRDTQPHDRRVALAWGQATFELNEFEQAIKAFREVANDGADPQLSAQAVLGEVEALRDISSYDAARAALNRLSPIAAVISDGAAKARIIAAGQCQLAGIARMDGELETAETAYETALAESLSAGDVRGALEARTWHAEILLARGRYRDALRTSTGTLAYAPFTNARWLTWARFVHGEAVCAAGKLADGLKVFWQALDEFARYGNPMGETWTLVAEASFRRPSDLIGAAHALEAAGEAADRYGGPLAYARARMLWEQAELARAQRDFAGSRERLHTFREHVKHSFPGGHAWLSAHGDALEAELERDCGGRNAAARAICAQSVYLQLGAGGAARRMAVSAWAANGAAVPTAREPAFARRWKRDGYALERDALNSVASGGYVPLHIWFVP